MARSLRDEERDRSFPSWLDLSATKSETARFLHGSTRSWLTRDLTRPSDLPLPRGGPENKWPGAPPTRETARRRHRRWGRKDSARTAEPKTHERPPRRPPYRGRCRSRPAASPAPLPAAARSGGSRPKPCERRSRECVD